MAGKGSCLRSSALLMQEPFPLKPLAERTHKQGGHGCHTEANPLS
jgi:hypothetical protein